MIMLESTRARQWLNKFRLEEFPEPDVIRLKYPVMLCHGYGAIASVIKPSPLHDAALLLRSHGIVAWAPNIVPYARIETRSEAWVQLLERILDEGGYDKVNIVAHSMGGLDIRHALVHAGIDKQVSSLTTIASPHHGTSLAEFALKTPNKLREKLGEFFDWVGNNIYPDIKSDALGPVEQLTREYICETFNPATPNSDRVSYYTYSAAVGEGTDTPINTLTRYQNHLIYSEEGLNDGFVSVESAKWGEHLKTIDLSHLEQMKLNVDKKRVPLWKTFWKELVQSLAQRGH